MKNFQKGFAPLIILLVLAVVAIGSGIYVYKIKKHKQPESTTTLVSKNDTTDIQDATSSKKIIRVGGFNTNTEYPFGTAILTFSISPKDLSLLQVHIDDKENNINTTYSIKNADTGLLYSLQYRKGGVYAIVCTDCQTTLNKDYNYLGNKYGDNWSRQLLVFTPEKPDGKTLINGKKFRTLLSI